MKIIRPVVVDDYVLDVSNITENDYAAYSGATTYALGDRVISTATHRIYESLQSANTNNALPVSPETITEWWQDIGATNRWKMFDGVVESQSSNADSIQVVMTPGRIDSLALLNIDAQNYRITLDAEPGSPSNRVYDSGTVLLEDMQTVGDWYEYFFEPLPIRKSDVVLTDIPPYTDGILTVTLSAPLATVKIGLLVVGLNRAIGDTQWKPNVGIVDYSLKTTDSFGNTSVTERTFTKRMTVDVIVQNHLIDYIIRVLSDYRATAVVWVGDHDPEDDRAVFTSMIIFGFFKSFDVVIDSPAGSICAIEIEGLA